jgi:hypothetical protein
MNTQTTILCVILAITGLLHSFTAVMGQTAPGDYAVSGTVVDSATQKPVPQAGIHIRTALNKPLKLAITRDDGSFFFAALAPASYTIEIVAPGYPVTAIPVVVAAGTPKIVSLGIIPLSAAPGHLQGVVVNTRKPLIKQEIDRITYDLQADPDSKGTSVLEMMRKIPYLSLDGDDNILLKGNTSYRILINGRPSGMIERNAKEVLRGMPASTIQRIEVITIPPSKYDGEGLGGIINIITNKKIDNGYNGTLNASEKFPVGGPGIGGSLTVKEDKLGISVFGGASASHSPQVENTINRQTTGAGATRLGQLLQRNSNSRNGYLGTELSVEVDSLQLLSVQFNLNGSSNKGASGQHSVLTGSSGGIMQQYYLGNNNKGGGGAVDVSLNYQLGFKADKNRLLTFSYRYSNYRNDGAGNLEVSDVVNYEQPDYRQISNEDAKEHTFQADYVRPGKRLNMEAGVKSILRYNKSDFSYLSYNAASDKFEPDAGRTNQFTNRQYILGAYNSWQFAIHKWGFKPGVRVEQTIVSADFISTASAVEQNYLNVIPSIAISRKLKENSSLNIGWTQRIKRPGINKLNPFVDRSNPNIESSGNPRLQPSAINEIQLGYSRSGKLAVTVGVSYGFARKLDLRVTTFDPATNVTRTTLENLGKARRVACDFSVNYPITRQWSSSINGNTAYMRVEGLSNGVLSTKRWMMYSCTVSSGYRFTKGWRINTNVSVNSRNPSSLQATSNGFVKSSFGLNKELVKNKLSFNASVANPFATHRNVRTETIGHDFTEVNTTAEYFRSFNISVNYSFGKLKEAIRKNKRGIKNDDGGSGGN